MSAFMVAVMPRTTSRALATVLSGCASVPAFVSSPFGATKSVSEVIAPPLPPLATVAPPIPADPPLLVAPARPPLASLPPTPAATVPPLATAPPDVKRELADLLPQVLSALAAEDPKLALAAALELLRTHGLVQESLEGPAHFEFEHHGHKLSLVAAQPGFDRVSLDASLRCALQLGFMRANQHEERGELAERYELLSAASFEGIMINADAGVVIETTQRLAKLVGYEQTEMLGRQTMARCIAPKDL